MSAMAKLLDASITVLVPVVSLFVMWLAHRLIAAFEKKSGVDVPTRWEYQINDWISEGIGYAEEQGHKAIKNNETMLQGPEKVELAASYVMDLVDKYDVKDMAKDALVKKIEAMLGVERNRKPLL